MNINVEKLAEPIFVVEQKDEYRYGRNKFKEYKYIHMLCQIDKNLDIIDETNYDSKRMDFVSNNQKLDPNYIEIPNVDVNNEPKKKVKKTKKKVKKPLVDDDDEDEDDEDKPQIIDNQLNTNYDILKLPVCFINMDEIDRYLDIKNEQIIGQSNDKIQKSNNIKKEYNIRTISEEKFQHLLEKNDVKNNVIIDNNNIDNYYCIFDDFWYWIKTLNWSNIRTSGDCIILINNTISHNDDLFIDDIQYEDDSEDFEQKLNYYYYTYCIKYFTNLFLFKLNTYIPVLVNNEPPAYRYQSAIQNIIGIGWETYKTLYTSIETFLFILNENERICEVDFNEYYFKIKEALKL